MRVRLRLAIVVLPLLFTVQCGGATSSGVPAADAGPLPANPACPGPFGKATPVDGVNTPAYNRGSLTPDERTIYFTVSEDSGTGIWTATRTDRRAAFSPPVPVAGLPIVKVTPSVSDPTWAPQNPTISRNELTIYFAKYRSVKNGPRWMLASASRATSDAAFTLDPEVPIASFPHEVREPFLTADERTLYYSGYENVIARVSSSWQDKAPTVVLENAVRPVLSSDERTMYFLEATNFQMSVATRPNADSRFGAGRAVEELASTDHERSWPDWLSPDGCRIYITRVVLTPGELPIIAPYVAERRR